MINRTSQNKARSPAEAIEKFQRKEFSITTKKLAWERCGGRCEGTFLTGEVRNGFSCFIICGAPIDIGCFHYDHVDPTWMSGRNDLANCQVLCISCHKQKTKADSGMIAKVKRIIKKHTQPRRRSTIPYRKFDGTPVWPERG